MDAGQLYAHARGQITDLVRSLSGEELTHPVPACPGWCVQDIVAHLAGTTTDVTAGNLEGAGGDAWTGAQVAARKGRALDELLAEWGEGAPRLEGMLPGLAGGAVRLVADAVIHHHDILEAVGRPGDLTDPATDTVFQGLVADLGRRLSKKGLGALRLRAGDQEWTVGEGEPQATVTADAYELFRGISGRRSVLAMAAWDWEGEQTAAYVDALPIFTPPAEGVNRLGDADTQHSPTAPPAG